VITLRGKSLAKRNAFIQFASQVKAPEVFESVLLAEMNLGMPPTSFYALLREPNDWSFVLKLHCVFECALAQLVERRAADDTGVETTFVGKVQSAFQVPFLSGGGGETFRSFLLNLNFLRNRFAHNAKYMSADIWTILRDVPLPKRRLVLAGLKLASDRPDYFVNIMARAVEVERFDELPDEARKVIVRGSLVFHGGLILDLISTAYYIAVGNDGKFYFEDFRPQLQDLLHDPTVIEFLQKLRSDMGELGLGGI
jgi:hypothetical protein